MKKFHSNSIKALAFSASAIAFVVAGPVYAQDADEPAQDEEEQADVTTAAPSRTDGGNITVTGSRIVRDTYSSISPLQVLTTENQQAVGAFDPAQILQRSAAAAGTQIDATFNGFVLDNGPGAQTINLRGLDPSRTLLLVNGRRLSPSGAEGAPTSPSINLIPGTLVDRFEILTDGASSIYGSDAVAGVVNVILRKDFNGLEIQGVGDINPQGEGEDYTISAAWGKNFDRGVFGIGAEYQVREEWKLRDRDFLRGCTTNLEEDADGNIYRLGISDNAVVRSRSNNTIGVSESECTVTGIGGRIFQPYARFGSVYFPANGNIANFPIDPRTGRPFNFAENTNAFGRELDINGDGIRDVDFQNVNTNASPEELDRTIVSGQELVNVFAYGEYTFPGAGNITPFFEAAYTRAEIKNTGAGLPQIFPSVPAANPFNPCNFVTNANGVDCRSVDNALQGLTNGVPPALSVGIPVPTLPIVSIRGDRNNFEVVQEQYRGVLGVRGDLPFIGSSWTFEVAGTYSRSQGKSSRFGIREDRLALSLGIDPTADFDGDGVFDNDGDGIADDYNDAIDIFFGDPLYIGECNVAGLANPSAAAPGLADGCVPVNLFAPSVLSGAVGDFASQAERDYLFDNRSFNTIYEQKMLSGYVTGDLFELPAGPVGVSFGGEWREDKIDSQPSFLASNGLLFGFFADGGASGSKWIRELFGEVDVPLMAGKTMVEELTVNVSGRLTDEEFYGTNGTFSLKGGWRPVAPLLLKFSYGTSFRAPNLRENFLRGQSGFTTLFDPCAVPDAAFVSGAYDGTLDQRETFIIDNCTREGRDPTRVGIDSENLNTISSVSGEITQGGSLDIEAETSRSITAGFAFEEDWASGFRFGFNFNYYDIKIKGAIIEPSGQFIINDCYLREDSARSEFCDRIEIDASDRSLISGVQAGFLNRDQESVRGIDLNSSFGYPLNLGSETIDLSLNLQANHLIERSNVQRTGVDTFVTTNFTDRFGFPEWTGLATFGARWKDFLFTYQVRYIDAIGNSDSDGVGWRDRIGFGDAFSGGPEGQFSPTCLGNGSPNGVVPGDGVFCRPVGTADEYFEHTTSVRWDNGDLRLILGVRNLFDEAPPQVSSRAGILQISNTPIGNGYDLNGREFFGQVLYRF
ncbi:TonB-dependent receptor domain-containing protein [Porphyrobacter sp. AAP60]|uniref:TonB-dependent receptor domain-containing protein n=1 Tax=Porphyrobacter sp. AAP60 TaxID=1523423 RepID=UPI0006B94DF8|nr:TonB-dependent receptor [Porphyrobacter sp. AAP60]KPF61980.1 TonB-dependent receptor [Porphyrobacter sp. AAP60]